MKSRKNVCDFRAEHKKSLIVCCFALLLVSAKELSNERMGRNVVCCVLKPVRCRFFVEFVFILVVFITILSNVYSFDCLLNISLFFSTLFHALFHIKCAQPNSVVLNFFVFFMYYIFYTFIPLFIGISYFQTLCILSVSCFYKFFC